MRAVVLITLHPLTGGIDYDHDVALAVACQYADDVTALAFGSAAVDAALQRAAALGANRLIRVEGEPSLARVVGAVECLEAVDVVFVAHMAEFGRWRPAALAATLGWLHDECTPYADRATIAAGHSVVASVWPGAMRVPLLVDGDARSVVDVWTVDVPEEPTPVHRVTWLGGASPEEIAAELVAVLEAENIPLRPLYDDDPLPSLTESCVIIGGGKGLAYNPAQPPPDAPDPFAWRVQAGFTQLLEPLARACGGAVAASRAVIDAGYVDAALQLGQSGRRVKPILYIAAGISGAVQHMQGVSGARVILAINPDDEAPVYDYAHYGVAADVYEVLPALLDALT